MSDLEFSELEHYQFLNYNLKIKSNLSKRLVKHVNALKHLEGSYTKKRWMQEAIREKVQAWENNEIENLERDCSLGFGISAEMNRKILKILKSLKKLGIKTTKTDFFLEALCEKLEREEPKTRKLFQEMFNFTDQKE